MRVGSTFTDSAYGNPKLHTGSASLDVHTQGKYQETEKAGRSAGPSHDDAKAKARPYRLVPEHVRPLRSGPSKAGWCLNVPDFFARLVFGSTLANVLEHSGPRKTGGVRAFSNVQPGAEPATVLGKN